MPQCKKSNCREEAVPFGKRYCPQHMREYKAKQAEYEQVKTTLRDCSCCGEKLTKTAHDRGDMLCFGCSVAADRRRTEERLQRDRERVKQRKMDELEAASTVADLKTWIVKYLVEGA